MSYYEHLFADYIEFEYINAPYEIDSIYDPFIYERYEGPFYGWGNYNHKAATLTGWVEACKTVIDYINLNGPYDGVVGFSLGTLIWRMLLK